VDEERNGHQQTDWNAWAMPARRTSPTTGAPPPAPPPPPPPWPYPGSWGGPSAPPSHSPYGPQPYGAYGPGHGAWGPPTRTNGLAIASLVCGILPIYWITSILALIFGYVAKSQIDRSQGTQTGRGMAVAGIVLGWVWLAVLALIIVLFVVGAASSDPSPNSF
jgi:hypothetical protein